MRRRAAHLGERLRRMSLAPACLAAGLLASCHAEHRQSSLHPAGPASETIARLWWFMFIVLTAVFIATMALLAIGVWKRPREGDEAPGGGVRFVVVAGIVLPAVVLVGLLLYSLGATVALRRPETALTIRVIGHRFWWEVHYPEQAIITANEMYIPVGVPILLELRSADVIHSFWAPNLGARMDMIPEHANYSWLRADRPGRFRGQCAEYCGLQHALMAFWVLAVPPDEFDEWVRQRQRPRHPEPPTERLRRGRDAFFHPDAGCYTCHSIRGTAAVGSIGPDLTHMAGRLKIGAGVLANTPENMRAWIIDPQEAKPGNRMPPTMMAERDLDALVEYLMSLH